MIRLALIVAAACLVAWGVGFVAAVLVQALSRCSRCSRWFCRCMDGHEPTVGPAKAGRESAR